MLAFRSKRFACLIGDDAGRFLYSTVLRPVAPTLQYSRPGCTLNRDTRDPGIPGTPVHLGPGVVHSLVSSGHFKKSLALGPTRIPCAEAGLDEKVAR